MWAICVGEKNHPERTSKFAYLFAVKKEVNGKEFILLFTGIIHQLFGFISFSEKEICCSLAPRQNCYKIQAQLWVCMWITCM